MTLVIKHLTDENVAAWDAYVAGHADGTFCHRAGWKFVVEAGAGHQCPYLYAEEDGEVKGVLPLTLRRSALFGNALVSSMFAVYGGGLYSNDAARDALDAAAWQIAEGAGIGVFESRTMKPEHCGVDGWSSAGVKAATFIRDLESSDEDELLLTIPRKQRAVVRKSLKAELTCDWAPKVSEVYALYAESVRNLGTPVFPRALFEAFAREFPDNHLLQLIKTPDGKPVASLFSFYDADTVLPYYAGGTPDARRYSAHDFMYFELMKHAAAQGIKRFDFGRSKVDTGPYAFKKNWGFEPMPLEYEYKLAEGAELPDLSPQSGKYAALVKVWKRLPLPVANWLGPMLARHLG
ncbi:FemAB family XrtA/PEP-CTERM system-associated protein [Kordiimonas sp.]|uniref:FemAB family XrtA/PEP-CTERM system-associated protein n=1 Tax=Kordiimonas sp. TaxID=1970157 RepID=UPI003B523AB7